MEIKKVLTFEKIFIFLTINIFILTQISSFTNVITWHHDYGITFNGSYRIFLGQLPHIDYQSVAPPATFFFPAISFFLFGVGDTQFSFAQISQNLLFFFISFKILSKFSTDKFIIFFCLYIFTIKYLINLDLPWYNSTAALFLHLSIFFLIKESHFNFLISGFFAAMTIYSKQDQGLMLICFAILFICYFEIQKKKKIKLLLSKLIIFFIPIIILSSLFYLINSQEFVDTFNFYKLAVSRVGFHGSGGQLKLLPEYQIPIILIIFLHLLCFENNKRFYIILFLLSSSLITTVTSGLTLTVLYWYLWPLFVIYNFFKKYKLLFIPNLKILIILKLALLIILLRTFLFAIPETQKVFIKKIINYPIVEKPYNFTVLSSIKNISFKNEEIIRFMENTVQYVNSNTKNKKVLNLTFLPINQEIKFEPLKNIPLWFQPGVSIFEEEIEFTNEIIKNQINDYIIIHKDSIGKDFILRKNLKDYYLIYNIDDYLLYEAKRI